MFKKFSTGFIASTLLLSVVVPVFADTTVDVSGNGAKSDNFVKIKQKCDESLYQSNKTKVGVNLKLVGNSGENNASGNTGGNVSIDTGDVTNSAVVMVTGGDNSADVPGCCCNGGDTDVTVSDNGWHSDNTVITKQYKSSSVTQKSKTKLWVDAELIGKTGKNKAKWNTGSGEDIKTGDVENGTEVVVEGGHNSL